MVVASIRKLAPLIGMSHTMLNKHLANGKFSAEPNGEYDSEKVKSALESTRTVFQPSQAKGAQAERQPEYRQPEEEAAGNKTFVLYNRARAQREALKAREAELDYKKRIGELIEVADAETAWGGMISATRGALLLLAAKLAPKVAAISDARECEAVIDKEIRLTLSSLSEYRPEPE